MLTENAADMITSTPRSEGEAPLRIRLVEEELEADLQSEGVE